MSIKVEVEGQVVKVGDYVGFKADVEQYAKIKKIRGSIYGSMLVLEAPFDGFEGEYITDLSEYTISASECWID